MKKLRLKKYVVIGILVVLGIFVVHNYIVTSNYSETPMQAIKKTLLVLNETPKEILYYYESDDVVFAIYTDDYEISHCAKIIKHNCFIHKQKKYKFRESINLTPTCFSSFEKINKHLFYIILESSTKIDEIDTCGYEITESTTIRTKNSNGKYTNKFIYIVDTKTSKTNKHFYNYK